MTVGRTMRACRIHEFGGAERLRVETVAVPEPEAGELLVKVAAASVNPIDWKMMSGRMQKQVPIELPRTFGRDCAGVIVASRSDPFKPGERVLAVADPRKDGTHAEYAVVPAAQAARLPATLSEAQAAAIGISGVTAWTALVEVARIKAGQRWLIHAGAGGVGSFAVQLARHFGAEVLATCGPHNVDYVKSLGAVKVIDYSRQDFVQEARDCDVVFDTVGGDTHTRSFAVLKPDGLLVYIHASPIRPPARADVRVLNAEIRTTPAQLNNVLELAASGAVKPQIGKVWPLAQAAEAYALSASGHSRGRIILVN